MRERVFALLIHSGVERFENLKQLLKGLAVQTYSVDSCAQARSLMAQVQPQLVFTDISLSDGSWVDVVIAADKLDAPLNVIVVGASSHAALRDVIVRGGAFALLSSPFDAPVVAGVVTAAAQDVRRRREIHARAAVA